MRKLSLTLLLALGTVLAHAQQPAQKWVADLEGRKIEWLKMTPNRNVILAGTAKLMLYGIDANSGEVLWESKAPRPLLAKLTMPAEIKDEVKSDIEGFFDRRVLFDEAAEDAALKDVIAVYNAERTQLTLLNINTGKALNAFPDALDWQKAVMPAFFLAEDRVMTGANGYGTALLQLPSGEPIWKNEHPIGEEPPIDDQLDIYANTSLVISDDPTQQQTAYTAAGESAIAKIDGQTGQTQWKIDADGKERFGGLELSNAQDKLLFLRLKPQENVVESIELADAATGKVDWAVDVSKEKATVQYRALSPDDQTFYVILQRKKRVDFLAIDMASGRQKWAQEFKLKKEDAPTLVATTYGAAVVSKKRVRLFGLEDGAERWQYNYGGDLPGYLMETDGGELLLFTQKDIEAIDPASGDTRWEARGGAPKVMRDGWMIVDFKDKGSVKIDLATGERLWKSKVMLSKVVVDVPSIGVVYKEVDKRGDEEMNILNVETGNPIWGQPIREPGAQILTEDKQMIIYSDGALVKVDPNAGRYTVFAKEIKFDEDETPDRIERVGDNYLLSSSQNLMMVDQQGQVVYHTYHRSVPQSALGKAAGLALTAVAVAGAVVSAADAAQKSATASYARGVGDYSAASYYQNRADNSAEMAVAFAAVAADGIELFSRRFKATQSSANYTFMLTKEGKDIKVVKLAKADGSKQRELAFKERKPVYRYDPAREQLYYRTGSSVLTCYEF